MEEERITYFAETDTRNKRVPFGIKAKDRWRHVYVIGKTGMGKSTLLENMAVQDIKNGEGMAFIDPHGKSAELLLDYVPQERIKDVLYFAPFDLDYPISFNVMEDVGHDKRHLVANGLMSAFKKIWVDAWSARMEYILNNILLALLEYPDSTLLGVNRMLADKDYRNKVVDNITDPAVKSFWLDEFAKYGEKYMQEAGAAIQNKIGQFVSNPVVRNIIGQPKSTFDIRKLMDEKKILIVNLSKGRVGEANANLLGSMLITKIYLGAMSRADASPAQLKRLPAFYTYVDEFQSFANESFADILSEARKYKLSLTMAHQYIEQMTDEVRAAVFGNVGTMVVFRVGAYDAEVLEKEFFPTFTQEDLVNLGFVQIYLKLMIDGVTSPPFSAMSLPPIETPLVNFKEDIIRASRDAYARPRGSVEEAILKWHQPLRLEGDRGKGGKDRLFAGRDPHAQAGDRGGDRGDHKPQFKNKTPEELRESIKAAMMSAFTGKPMPASAQGSSEAKPAPVAAAPAPMPRPIQQVQPQPKPQAQPQAQPQPASEASTQPPQPQKPAPQPERPKSRDDKERELRNVVAENYLKNRREEEERRKKEQDKKDKKGPTPENLNALRDALASVMGGAIPQVAPQPQAAPQPQPAPQQAQAPKPEQKPEQKAADKPRHHEPKRDEKKPEPKREELKQEPKADRKIPEPPQETKEVPEEVLKRILEQEQ